MVFLAEIVQYLNLGGIAMTHYRMHPGAQVLLIKQQLIARSRRRQVDPISEARVLSLDDIGLRGPGVMAASVI